MGSDLRLALRALARNPAYTAVIVLTLALGIGANTAIFSLFDQIVLRLLPVQNPEQLALFHSPGRPQGWASSDSSHTVYSLPIYREFAQSGLFEQVLARSSAPVSLAHGSQSERTRAELVSGNFFPALGVRPVRGRLFTEADDQTESGHPVAVLSHGYWQRRFLGAKTRQNLHLAIRLRRVQREPIGRHKGPTLHRRTTTPPPPSALRGRIRLPASTTLHMTDRARAESVGPQFDLAFMESHWLSPAYHGCSRVLLWLSSAIRC